MPIGTLLILAAVRLQVKPKSAEQGPLQSIYAPAGATEEEQSFEHETRVIFNSMLFQEYEHFLLKCHLPMELFLVGNIILNIPDVGLTHAEGRIARLPGDPGAMEPALMNPLG